MRNSTWLRRIIFAVLVLHIEINILRDHKICHSLKITRWESNERGTAKSIHHLLIIASSSSTNKSTYQQQHHQHHHQQTFCENSLARTCRHVCRDTGFLQLPNHVSDSAQSNAANLEHKSESGNEL
jgi:hypothetical protein